MKNEGLKGEGGYKEKGNDDTIIITQMWNISKIYTMDRKINYTFQYKFDFALFHCIQPPKDLNIIFLRLNFNHTRQCV